MSGFTIKLMVYFILKYSPDRLSFGETERSQWLEHEQPVTLTQQSHLEAGWLSYPTGKGRRAN